MTGIFLDYEAEVQEKLRFDYVRGKITWDEYTTGNDLIRTKIVNHLEAVGVKSKEARSKLSPAELSDLADDDLFLRLETEPVEDVLNEYLEKD